MRKDPGSPHPRLAAPALASVLLAAVLLLGLGRSAAAAQPEVVFITKSDACSCQRSLCVMAEQEVVNFLADAGEPFRLVRVDLAKTPDAARTYRAFAVPVVILRDANGEQVARFDAYLTGGELLEAWEAHEKGDDR